MAKLVGNLDWAQGIRPADLRSAEVSIDPHGLLGRQDRMLLVIVMKYGLSYREAAAVLDVGVGTICRRLRRLQALLRSPIARRLGQPSDLPEEDRRLIVEHLFRGRPVRALASELGVHHDRVRRRLIVLKQVLAA